MLRKFTIALLLCVPIFLHSEERIKMTYERGVYTIPCEVNGLKLQFVFDTGAADVNLSILEAAFMLKNGYIKESDFAGSKRYSMANGDVEENDIVILNEIKIGSVVLKDVKACISSNLKASLLLGQSAIRQLGEYSVNGDWLVINPDKKKNHSRIHTKLLEKQNRLQENIRLEEAQKYAVNYEEYFDDKIDTSNENETKGPTKTEIDTKSSYKSGDVTTSSSSNTDSKKQAGFYVAEIKAPTYLYDNPNVGKFNKRLSKGALVMVSSVDKGDKFRKVLDIKSDKYGYVLATNLGNFKKLEIDKEGNLKVEGRIQATTSSVKIKNNTNLYATITIGNNNYGFAPYEERTINGLTPGTYVNRATAPGVMPYLGYDTLEAGYIYSWVFYIEHKKSSNTNPGRNSRK